MSRSRNVCIKHTEENSGNNSINLVHEHNYYIPSSEPATPLIKVDVPGMWLLVL